MRLSDKLICGLLAATCTGTLAGKLWYRFREILEGKDFRMWEYLTIRLVCLFRIVPVISCIAIVVVSAVHFFVECRTRHMPPDVSSFHIFANGIAAYWGSITMDVIRSLLSEREIRAEKMVLNVPVGDREVRREFALIKNCLKIRGPVSLYSNARIISPATAGIIRQSVIIPERELILEEIRVTLCHELSHVKYHDTAFIMFSIAGSALYGEMCEPEFTDIVREAAERDCDRRAVAMMRRFEENAIKKYYTVIVDMIPEHPVDGWFLDLVSKSAFESMTDRIEYVTACERAGRAGAILGRAIAAGFLIAVTFFAYIIFVMIRRFDLWTCVMLLI